VSYARVILLGTLAWVCACEGTVGGESRGQPPTGGPPDESFPLERAVSPIVRRLTVDEYARTVRDVFGVSLTAEDLAGFPAARPIEGFVHIASGQTVSTDHVRAYAALARQIVDDSAFGSFVEQHSVCTEAESDCGRAFVARAGPLLFRKPLANDEVDGLTAVYEAVLAEGGDYEEAVRFTSEAMLQSPGFLYLLELENEGAGTRTIGGYEMASRLSYFLWGSSPDEALYEAAARGDLDTAEGVEAEALRLLEDRDRVRERLERFVVDWARLQSLPDDDGLKADRIEGSVGYYLDRVDAEADLFSLFGDRLAFLTGALAEAYGLPSRGAPLQRYELPQEMGPGGLLGQPGVVAGMTNADGGEIVARGLFLMSQLFCETPPQFAASLQESIDAFVAEQPPEASDREIADARMLRAECAGCHGTFDPLAYGFEQLDFRGAFRTSDEFGNALRTDGWIPAALSDDGAEVPYSDIDDYMARLSESLAVRRCLARHQVEFALGLRTGAGQERAIAEIGAESQANGGDHRSLVRAIVTHDSFRTTAVVP